MYELPPGAPLYNVKKKHAHGKIHKYVGRGKNIGVLSAPSCKRWEYVINALPASLPMAHTPTNTFSAGSSAVQSSKHSKNGSTTRSTQLPKHIEIPEARSNGGRHVHTRRDDKRSKHGYSQTTQAR